jgi:DNA-binding LacI/PurR family transcriptional regulator
MSQSTRCESFVTALLRLRSIGLTDQQWLLTAQIALRTIERMSRPQGGGGAHHRRTVTIYDVAAAAGVSHQTIANVIKDPSRVAPATRELVQRHIADLGFRPNRLAQNLSKRRTRLIGFHVRERSTLTSGGILDAFLQSLAEAAEELDHHIVLFHSAPGLDEVAKATELYRASIADAFVVAETSPGDPRIPALVDAGLAFVTFGRTDGSVEHHSVDTDNVAGSRMAAAHLVELGHRRIGFLGWPGPSWVGSDRRRGWHDELTSRRLDADDSLVAEAANDRSSAAAAWERLLAAQPPLTAVVAASDELALGAQQAAEQAGRRLSVVGYDDSPLATIGAGLTTVRQPIPAIARRIVGIASRLAAGDPESSPTHEQVTPELIVRGSTTPPDSPSRINQRPNDRRNR